MFKKRSVSKRLLCSGLLSGSYIRTLATANNEPWLAGATTNPDYSETGPPDSKLTLHEFLLHEKVNGAQGLLLRQAVRLEQCHADSEQPAAFRLYRYSHIAPNPYFAKYKSWARG